jgi:hypothetical protein
MVVRQDASRPVKSPDKKTLFKQLVECYDLKNRGGNQER